MAINTTKRTMDHMRARGYRVVRVENYNFFAKKKYDLCGCDVLAMKVGEPLTLIQSTTASHRNARLDKLSVTDTAALWVNCGGKILVHGWQPLVKSRRKYEVLEIEWRPTTGGVDQPLQLLEMVS